MSLREIATHFGLASSGAVSYWLRKYDLKTQPSISKNITAKLMISDEQLASAVADSVSYSGVLKRLRVNQSSYKHFRGRIRRLNLDTSHFTGKPEVYVHRFRRSADEVLVVLPEGSLRVPHARLKRAMLDLGVLYKCVSCGNIGEWLGYKLDLEIDHVDGNWRNNLIENLRFLCPNCHGITPTHRNKNLALEALR